MDYPIAQRTSYDVFAHHLPTFKDYFEIEFDMALYSTQHVGYVVRCKEEGGKQIFNLFFDPRRGDDVLFCLNQEEQSVLISQPINLEELVKRHWFKVKIGFNLKEDEITLEIQGRKRVCKSVPLSDEFRPHIIFGKSDHIIDIPPIAINNLRVNGTSESYLFALNETEKTEDVFDSKGKLYGEVKNPLWLSNEANHWRKDARFESATEAGTCYNPAKDEIYYFNRDTLFIYNVRSGESTIQRLANSCPLKMFLVGCFVDNEQQKLYVYETYHGDQYTGPMVVSLDLETLLWTVESNQQLDMHLHHHDGFYNPMQKRHTIFGGFGNMRYSNRFYQLDVKDKNWSVLDSLSGDVICPRYFSAVGYQDSTHTAYIFGGMGNESGEQIVGRKYLYDFYKVDLEKKKIQKLWDFTGCPTRKVPARGMIIPNDSCFYVLCYPESVSKSQLKLYGFSIENGSYRQFADSIPILSDKITTNAHLYYNEHLSRLFVTVQESNDDVSSSLTVYSLLFPPITADEYANRSMSFYTYLRTHGLTAAILLAAVVGLAILAFARRFLGKPSEKKEAEEKAKELCPAAQPANADPLIDNSAIPNSIYLFGEFTVIDRNKRNISYLYPTRIRQMFCLILRYSNADGIPSKQLSDLIWPDKSKDKVKNSRGVTINHLRKALSELDGIELVYEKGCFRFIMSDGFHCDYQREREIIAGNKTHECRKEFLHIIGRGKFLHSFDDQLFDSFKQEVECELEALLLKQMEEAFEAHDYQTAIVLSEAEFNIDPLNETALLHNLKSLFMLKRENAAITSYQKFIAEYKKSTGEDYPHSFRYYWC